MPLMLITSQEWNALVSMVEDIHAMASKIDQNIVAMETKMTTSLDDVIADIEDLGTKEDGLIALTKGLQQQVKDALGGTITADQQAKIDQVFAAVEARKTAIQEALDAGTPPSPAPDPGNPSQAPTGDQPQVNPEMRKR